MTRVEIQGWLQVVLSIIAIWVAVLTAGPSLDAVGQASIGGGLPAEFQGASGALRVFLVILVLSVLLTLLLVGLGMVLSVLFRRIDAAMPGHAAFTLVAAVVFAAAAVTMAILGQKVWMPAATLAAVSLFGAGLAGWDRTGHRFWTVMSMGWIGALVGGLWLAAVVDTSPPSPVVEVTDTDPVLAAADVPGG